MSTEVVIDSLDVVEIKSPPHVVTEVIGLNDTGLVEVRNQPGVLFELAEPQVSVEIVTSGFTGPIGPAGPKGDDGAAGDPGPMGPTGPVGPFAPIFEQHFASASATWVIHHNMNVYPVVTLVDLYGQEIGGDVATPDRNTVVVNFEVPFAGTARLKA